MPAKPAVISGPWLVPIPDDECLHMGCFPLDEMETDVAQRLVLNTPFTVGMANALAGEGVVVSEDGKLGVSLDTSEFGDKLTSLEASLTTVIGDVATLEAVVDGHSEDLTGMSKDIEGMLTRVSINEGALANQALVIANQAKDISDIQTGQDAQWASLAAVTARVGTAETGLSEFSESLESIASDLAGVYVALTSLTDRVTEDEGSLTALDGQVKDGAAKLEAVTERLEDEEEYTADLSSELSSAKLRIDGHDTSISAISGNVTTLQTDVTTLQTDLSAIQSRLSTAELAISSITAAMGEIASNLAAHIEADADLYQNLLSEAVRIAQDIYNGTVPQLDMDNPQVIIGSGGLLSLNITGSEWVAPGNGAVMLIYKATLLGVSPVATKNGVEVFGDGLSILDIGNGKPVEVRTEGGDVWTFSGSLGLLASFNATFYPNK